jgi:CubicO group peptidase (beta-lactamase class C family)
VSDGWSLTSTTISVLVGVTGALVVLGLVRMAVHRPAAATGDPALAARLNQLVGKRTRRLAAVTIDLNASTVCRMAYIGADADTRFEMGSVTKGLTGMLAADAIAREEITMQSTLGDLSSRYRSTSLESVTVEELCTHTSGLPSTPRDPRMWLRAYAAAVFGIDPYRGMDVNHVIRAGTRQRLRTRGRYGYSNLGAAVLGHAVAESVGSNYAEVLVDRILAPLGMTATTADAHNSLKPARGWTKYGRRSWLWRAAGYAPAGGVVSTAGDMAILAVALLDGSTAGHGALRPVPGYHPGQNGSLQAMFWIVNTVPGTDRTEVWHNGETGGYSAVLAVYPQARRVVVVMADVAAATEQQRIATELIRWTVHTDDRPHGREPT